MNLAYKNPSGDGWILEIDAATACAIGHAMMYVVDDADAWESRVLVDPKLDAAARRFYQHAVTLHDSLEYRYQDIEDWSSKPCPKCMKFVYLYDEYGSDHPPGWYTEDDERHRCRGEFQWTKPPPEEDDD
jgi:hypothetical protein